MRTEDLIKLLSEDAPVALRLGRIVLVAVLAGAAISSTLLVATVGIRADLGSAILSLRVLFKIGVTITLSAVACNLLLGVARPGVPLLPRVLLFAIPLALLVSALLAELLVMPPASWTTRLIGHNALFCLMFIPVLAAGPLIGFLLVMRHGAPESPGLAGATAGLAAGAIGSAAYAWHCPDDSPLFVATWYTLAVALVAAAGYLAGRRSLRW